MTEWWWQIEEIEGHVFWISAIDKKYPWSSSFGYVVANSPASREIGRQVLGAAKRANSALTLVYKLTYGSLP
jgi:hypothetical protein